MDHTLSNALLCALLLLGCDSRTPLRPQVPSRERVRIEAANNFTERYSGPRMQAWKIRANAAGPDCDFLLIRAGIILDPSMIDAVHFGVGAYDLLPGGVDEFYRANTFRGVIYSDPTPRTWTYGSVPEQDHRLFEVCA